MRQVRQYIPSMFTRRLLLLLVVMTAAIVLLMVRLAAVTVMDGDEHLAEAQSVLVNRALIRTHRGSVLDRKGRVLAEDRPCIDIELSYTVISEEWAYQSARNDAYREHRARWRELSLEDREALVRAYMGPYEDQLRLLWDTIVRLGGIDREELDRRRRTIIERVMTIRASVWDRLAKRRSRELDRAVELSEVAVPVREQFGSHPILEAVPDEVGYEFRKLAARLPGVKVIASKTRHYPHSWVRTTLATKTLPKGVRGGLPAQVEVMVGPVAGHLIGTVGEVQKEHIDQRPFWRPGAEPDRGGYLPGDTVGMRGVESAVESILRGSRGQKVIQRDTGKVVIDDPSPGWDVHLTIDVSLQARIEALMDPRFGLMRRSEQMDEDEGGQAGLRLNGAVVVLDVDSGDVLSMVSSPPFPSEQTSYSPLDMKRDAPFVNRPVEMIAAPGSTIKPLVYAIAATQGVISHDRVFECRGHLLDSDPNSLRCWIFKRFHRGHGPLGPSEAIARSCNIYFYECGRKLEAGPLVEGLTQWGFGEPMALGIKEENRGIMPRLEGNNTPGRALSLSNAIQMGIGQGPIAVPPMQVAAAHAALARGGYYMSPVLIEEFRDRQKSHDLRIPPRVVAETLKGMFGSANSAEMGTGHHLPGGEVIINVPDVVVRAKTGTATAPTQFDDANDNHRLDDGETVWRRGDHSWYVCHVQKKGAERASFIVCVLVEYGGSGGKVAGPIANQVIWALRQEGYL